jgi:hypothetical protein
VHSVIEVRGEPQGVSLEVVSFEQPSREIHSVRRIGRVVIQRTGQHRGLLAAQTPGSWKNSAHDKCTYLGASRVNRTRASQPLSWNTSTHLLVFLILSHRSSHMHVPPPPFRVGLAAVVSDFITTRCPQKRVQCTHSKTFTPRSHSTECSSYP